MAAAEDSDVLHHLWDARLPLELTLCPDDVSAAVTERPKPFYVLVPRVSYLTLVLDKAQRYFQPFTQTPLASEQPPPQLWLDCDGVPLKWQLPIGVLFDLLHSTDSATLPWQLTLHYRRFPDDRLLQCRSLDVAEAHYMHVIKEADQLKHRGAVVNAMQRRDHKQLWAGLCSDRYEQFWAVNRRLMVNTDEEPLRHFPFKLYTPYADRAVSPDARKPSIAERQMNTVPVQWLLRLTDEKPLQHTLLDLLKILKSSGRLPDTADFRLISHGVELPLETPLLWLTTNFAYPDNFVHLIAIDVQ